MTYARGKRGEEEERTSRHLRIVTLLDHLTAAGGAERFATSVAMRLDPARFQRTLCIARPASPVHAGPSALRAALAAADVRLLELNRGSTFDLRAWRPLVQLLRRERVDVLHAHKFGSNVWGTLLGRLAGVPVVVAHEQTWSFEGRPMRRLLDRHLIARGSSAFVAVSSADRERMIDIEGIPPDDVILIPNGIATEGATGADVRRELGIPPEAPVPGSVAVLRPQKEIDVLIRAVPPLLREFPDLQLLIAGDGQERPALEGLIGELGVGEAVLLLGSRSDIPDVLSAVDVAVSSSRFEGTPLAVMEYMAAGKPVVATRVGGVPDLIEEGEQGLLVEPRDSVALAGAIRRLLRDPAEARRMGARGRERQRTEFDLDVAVRRLEQLYETLVARIDGHR